MSSEMVAFECGICKFLSLFYTSFVSCTL